MSSADKFVLIGGMPRSGTSLVMQMLIAGGAPLLTDEVRSADADNPRGYFELGAFLSALFFLPVWEGLRRR